MNKRKSATVVKSYLESPFNPTWPVVEQEHQAKIRVILGKVPPRKQQSRKRKRTEETQLNHKSDSKIVGTPKRVKPYVSGVNEVTKALEKDRLSVVFICRSVKPQTLVEHLLPLAHVNKTKICAMYDLSILLGNLVGTKMCTAVGILKQSEMSSEEKESLSKNKDLRELQSFVLGHVPDTNIPWLVRKGENLPPAFQPAIIHKLSFESRGLTKVKKK
eukprot:m.119647 g.119647  ORF g.119647 m.119647 type:complete len:217 (+) comp14325_c0_seq10:233-883(+)